MPRRREDVNKRIGSILAHDSTRSVVQSTFTTSGTAIDASRSADGHSTSNLLALSQAIAEACEHLDVVLREIHDEDEDTDAGTFYIVKPNCSSHATFPLVLTLFHYWELKVRSNVFLKQAGGASIKFLDYVEKIEQYINHRLPDEHLRHFSLYVSATLSLVLLMVRGLRT